MIFMLDGMTDSSVAMLPIWYSEEISGLLSELEQKQRTHDKGLEEDLVRRNGEIQRLSRETRSRSSIRVAGGGPIYERERKLVDLISHETPYQWSIHERNTRKGFFYVKNVHFMSSFGLCAHRCNDVDALMHGLGLVGPRSKRLLNEPIPGFCLDANNKITELVVRWMRAMKLAGSFVPCEQFMEMMMGKQTMIPAHDARFAHALLGCVIRRLEEMCCVYKVHLMPTASCLSEYLLELFKIFDRRFDDIAPCLRSVKIANPYPPRGASRGIPGIVLYVQGKSVQEARDNTKKLVGILAENERLAKFDRLHDVPFGNKTVGNGIFVAQGNRSDKRSFPWLFARDKVTFVANLTGTTVDYSLDFQ